MEGGHYEQRVWQSVKYGMKCRTCLCNSHVYIYGFRIICPEGMAGILRPNQNPKIRNKRKKKRCPWTESWDHLWLLGGRHRRSQQIRNQRNGQRVKIISNYHRNHRKNVWLLEMKTKDSWVRDQSWWAWWEQEVRSHNVRSKCMGRKWTSGKGWGGLDPGRKFPLSQKSLFKYLMTALKSSPSLLRQNLFTNSADCHMLSI